MNPDETPEAGDVVAQASSGYSDASGHVGIVLAPGITISASSKVDLVRPSAFGFEAHDKGKVLFRRYDPSHYYKLPLIK